ncbi:MAG: hypothetical protein RJA31_534 [Actinomycetota bacterium]
MTRDNGNVNPEFRGRTAFGTFLLVFGLLSVAASITLATEGFWLLKDGVQPSCNINPFFSCGNVMQSEEAHQFFTVPNYFWGIAGWGVVAATGAVMLAGATLARWYWRIFAIGMFAAWGFLMWLFTEAVYDIGFLCLWCMATWTTQTIMVWIITPWLMREKLLFDNERVSRIGAAVLPYSWILPVINLGAIALLIIQHFPLLLPLLLNGN